MQAKYPVKVQAIRSKGRTDRFYVFIPRPLAAAIGLEAGEEIQWSLSDRDTSITEMNGSPGVARSYGANDSAGNGNAGHGERVRAARWAAFAVIPHGGRSAKASFRFQADVPVGQPREHERET